MSNIPLPAINAVKAILEPYMSADEVEAILADKGSKDLGKLLTAKQVANRLNISEWTVKNWIRQGRLKSKKFGKVRRIYEAHLDEIN